jgi:hypothetical protein
MTDQAFTLAPSAVRPAGDFDCVGVRVGPRLAGSLVVRRGLGDPLARHLLSTPIIEAARAVARLYRRDQTVSTPVGLTSLDEIEHVLGELVRAVDAVDAVDTAEARPEEPDDTPPGELRTDVDPTQLLITAGNRLMYGNDEGREDKTHVTCFRAVLVSGVVVAMTPDGPEPRSFGAFQGQGATPECWLSLAEQLGEVADDLRTHYIAHSIAPGDRTCRVCKCTDDDCSQCVEKTGAPCHWIEADLCSACVGASR